MSQLSLEGLKLGRILGEGATAVTFLARDEQGREVCVKRYKSALQVKDQSKIQRELSILQRTSHPQIPRFLGSFIKEEQGRKLLHVIQELIDGADLGKYLQQHRFSLPETQRLIGQLLKILEYLHSQNPAIVHRDIKPSNIMLRPDAKIVLIDFGQAIDEIHRTYGQTMVTGTLGYQAPEQIYGEATPLSDIYSTGVLAIELLLNKSPSTMLEGQRLGWERHCRHLPIPIQEWLDGMLAPNQEDRFNAQQALQKLQEISGLFIESRHQDESVAISAKSSEFLSRLDDAILDEEQRKRELREQEHREQVQKERIIEQRRQMEADWKTKEESLWLTMEESWMQLLKAVHQDRLSKEKGCALFVDTFVDQVKERIQERKWGEVHPSILMLLSYAKGLDVKEEYVRWLKEERFKSNFEKIQMILSKMNKVQPQIETLNSQLADLGFWEGIFGRTKLENQHEQAVQELKKLQQEKKQAEQELNNGMRLWTFGLMDATSIYSIYLQMVKIPKVSFMMGALENDKEAFDNEKLRHSVTLSRDFWMGKYPVTQSLWQSVMGDNPSYFKGSNRPVETVTWFDVVDFCNKLSLKEGLNPVYTINGEDVKCDWTANGYRLPTEAEWEYAARGGEYHLYAGSNNIDEVAWYDGNSGKETQAVGLKKSNGFGLYDMSGNVWEWVWDWKGSYSSNSVTDPTGPNSGSDRVFRGGSWVNFAGGARVSYHGRYDPTYRGNDLGFRLSRITP